MKFYGWQAETMLHAFDWQTMEITRYHCKDIAEKLADNGMFERVENVNAYEHVHEPKSLFAKYFLKWFAGRTGISAMWAKP